jgi:hypothetical protein
VTGVAHPLRLEHGHLLTEIDGRRYIVDSGSPLSFGGSGSIAAGGRLFSLPPAGPGINAQQLSELTGFPTDGLLGMDILGEFDLLLDLSAGSLTLFEERLTQPGDAVPVKTIAGVPVAELQCGERRLLAFLDSGAQHSYLPAGFDDGGPGEDLADFHPFLGRFPVVLRRTRGGLRIGPIFVDNHRHAEPPATLALTLTMAGVQGIAGVSIFTRQPVSLSIRGGWLV